MLFHFFDTLSTSKEELEVFVEEIKKCGLTNKKGEKDYSYLVVKKYLEEENIAKLQSKKKKIKLHYIRQFHFQILIQKD